MVQNVIRFLPLVLTTFLSMSVSVSASQSRSRVVHKSLARRVAGELLSDLKLSVFTGTRWTFYDAGMGACGATNENKDHIVALNAIQFGIGYPGPQCFKKITMEYNGKKTTATVMDMCPECPYGALDLSRGLFDFFAPEDEGVIYGQWYFGEDPRRGGEGEGKPPSPSKSKSKSKPPPTHVQVHAPNRPVHASRPTPLDQSGKQQPASEKNPNLPSPARLPLASVVSAARPSNAKMIMDSEISSNTKILKPATSNAASILKGTPLKSEYVSEDESEHSENLVAFNTIFGRLGSIAAAGSATNHRNE